MTAARASRPVGRRRGGRHDRLDLDLDLHARIGEAGLEHGGRRSDVAERRTKRRKGRGEVRGVRRAATAAPT
jgi:hypothetical protein